MANTIWNPDTLAAPFAAYSHCCSVPAGSRVLTIAGQVGVKPDGEIAVGFEQQCEWTFRNLLEVLRANDMDATDLIKLGIYLTDRDDLGSYREVRNRLIGEDIAPPGTLVIVSGLANPDWLVEVEAYAAKVHQ